MKDEIWQLGHQVLSTWLDEVAKPEFMNVLDFRIKLAIKDLCEVSAADLLILDSMESSGGKNFEAGFAFAHHQNKLFWVIGKCSNIFQELADDHFDSWDDCLKYLADNFPSEVRTLDAMVL